MSRAYNDGWMAWDFEAGAAAGMSMILLGLAIRDFLDLDHRCPYCGQFYIPEEPGCCCSFQDAEERLLSHEPF